MIEFYSWTASQLIFFVLFWYFIPCVFYFVVYSKLESWASVHLILLACYFLSVVFVFAFHGICCYFYFCYFRLPAWCTVKFLISVLCIKFLCLFSVVCLSFCSVFSRVFHFCWICLLFFIFSFFVQGIYFLFYFIEVDCISMLIFVWCFYLVCFVFISKVVFVFDCSFLLFFSFYLSCPF